MCKAVEESPEETDDMHFSIVRGNTKLTISPTGVSDDGLTEQQQQTADNAMAFTQMAGVDRVVRVKTYSWPIELIMGTVCHVVEHE